MLKRLTVAAFAILFAYCPNISRAQQKQKGQEPPTSSVTTVDNSTRGDGQNAANQKAPEPHAGIEWSNWALVVVGALGVLAAYCTLRSIERQTKAAENAAKATLKQSEHMATSERAWITVYPSDLHPQLYPAWEQGTPYTKPEHNNLPVIHQMGITIKNAGKTPARIDAVALHYVRIASLAELPDEPNYGNLSPHGGILVIPKEKYYGKVDLETDHGFLYERHIKELKSREAILFIFWIVKYRDVYENPRETRFGFHYEYPIPGTEAADGSELVPVFRKAGPQKYNDAN